MSKKANAILIAFVLFIGGAFGLSIASHTTALAQTAENPGETIPFRVSDENGEMRVILGESVPGNDSYTDLKKFLREQYGPGKTIPFRLSGESDEMRIVMGETIPFRVSGENDEMHVILGESVPGNDSYTDLKKFLREQYGPGETIPFSLSGDV